LLTTSQSYVTYQGNGAASVFPFNFLVPSASQLVVSITNNNVSLPVTTLLTNTQYSVTGIGNTSGGSVTYPTSGILLQPGWSITIQRVVSYQQNTSLTNQGAFYPQVVETCLDVLTMQTQQLAAALSRETPFILPAGINWTGTWNPTQAYNQGDGVSYNSQVYVALSGNTGYTPATNPLVWVPIAVGPQGTDGTNGTPGINWRGAYSAGTAYSQGDGVSYSGSLYVALQSTTGNLPTSTTYWQPAGATGPAGPAWTAANKARAFRANGLQLYGGNNQKVAIDTVSYDPNSIVSVVNGRITPTAPGTYSVKGMVNCVGLSSGFVQALIAKNGNVYSGGDLSQELSGYAAANFSDDVPMNGTTDYLELWCFVNGAGWINNTGSAANYMSIFGPF
jgi:hypothetical protein